MNRIKIFYEDHKSWFTVISFILLAVVLAFFMVALDSGMLSIQFYLPEMLSTNVELGKTILNTLLGSFLTITTFTFSTMLTVLTLYSSDFTPHVVENFIKNPKTMKVLGIFTGGFFFCVITLFFMREAFSQNRIYSATVAVVYSSIAVYFFIRFVFQIASSIQLSNLLETLYDEAKEIMDKSIERYDNWEHYHHPLDEQWNDTYENRYEIRSLGAGYLNYINLKRILAAHEKKDSLFHIQVRVGDYITRDQLLGQVYADFDENIKASDLRAFSDEFELLDKPMRYRDYNFAIQKIVEVGVRAISPSVNDPNTCIQCMHFLTELLSRIAPIDKGYVLLEDQMSRSKVVFEAIDFPSDVKRAFTQLIIYAKADLSVMLVLMDKLRLLCERTSKANRKTLKDFCRFAYEKAEPFMQTDYEKQRLYQEGYVELMHVFEESNINDKLSEAMYQ